MAKRPSDTATGALVRYVPAGPERDELLGLVRIGAKFAAQQSGRKPGFLARYIADLVANMAAPVTFEKLIRALEIAAALRDGQEEAASPIEQCSRTWRLLTYHDPRHGRLQVTFKRLRNILTDAKREKSRLPLSRESSPIESRHTALVAGHTTRK